MHHFGMGSFGVWGHRKHELLTEDRLGVVENTLSATPPTPPPPFQIIRWHCNTRLTEVCMCAQGPTDDC